MRSSPVPLASPRASSLLVGFLTGNNIARERFVSATEAEIKRLAYRESARYCKNVDFAGDIYVEFHALLSEKKPDYYDPAFPNIDPQLRRLIKTAAGHVRDENHPWFQPKNPARTKAVKAAAIVRMEAARAAPGERPPKEAFAETYEMLSLDSSGDTADGDKRVSGHDDPAFHATTNKMVVHHLVQRAAATAKPSVHQLMLLMRDEHLSMTEIADALGIPHWQLRRDINRWLRKEHMEYEDFR